MFNVPGNSCSFFSGRPSAGQMDTAGSTMQQIVDAVQKVSALMREVAEASQEQSSGIGLVNTAVTQMDGVVQQNAALVEEATAALHSMSAQAHALLHSVRRFRLAEDEADADVEAVVVYVALSRVR